VPLKSGTSQETISENISETLESPTFARGKPKKKRRQMAVAASMRKKRETLSQAAMRHKK
jgi:hypothetical protein